MYVFDVFDLEFDKHVAKAQQPDLTNVNWKCSLGVIARFKYADDSWSVLGV